MRYLCMIVAFLVIAAWGESEQIMMHATPRSEPNTGLATLDNAAGETRWRGHRQPTIGI